MAKKRDLAELDPDIANDPATLHTVLSKMPPLTTETQSPSHSQPNSPQMRATRSNGHSRVSNAASDPDVDVPVLLHSLPDTGTRKASKSRKPTGPQPLVLEKLFTTALHLYELFPPDHPEISANTIFGSQSAIFTWENADLNDEEAEKIVANGTDVIIPEPVEEAEEEKEQKENVNEDAEIIKRRRQMQKTQYISRLFANPNTTIFALVGLAGVLLAMYTRDESMINLGARGWMRNNWILRWVLTRL